MEQVTTNAIKEWVAAAGVWTPQDRRHALPVLDQDDPEKGFAFPRETKNIEDPAKHRRMVSLDDFMGGPSGLTWERTDAAIPSGREIKNFALAKALEICVHFTTDELAEFGIQGFLREDHFIKSGESLSNVSPGHSSQTLGDC